MTFYVKNDKVGFDYEILEKFTAGLELKGGEVKAIKSGQGSLKGSRVVIRGGEAFLVGAHISLYQPNNLSSAYEEERPRRLLLSKKEISYLAEKENVKGLTIIPLGLYNKGKLIKIDIAVARGKKKYDKRQDIKKKMDKRSMERTLKIT
ncbi:MAG TPA: SsrA-binding protein SmpB [Candidatus Vogelbacteria bacterium]|nr:SsrA-binding protein SmpB [Candidatus Vogelbacteria bacterium]